MARLKVIRPVRERGKQTSGTPCGRRPKRINDVVVKEDRPEIRGMIFKVNHLVKVEEVE